MLKYHFFDFDTMSVWYCRNIATSISTQYILSRQVKDTHFKLFAAINVNRSTLVHNDIFKDRYWSGPIRYRYHRLS